jgi:hypothetical protein
VRCIQADATQPVTPFLAATVQQPQTVLSVPPTQVKRRRGFAYATLVGEERLVSSSLAAVIRSVSAVLGQRRITVSGASKMLLLTFMDSADVIHSSPELPVLTTSAPVTHAVMAATAHLTLNVRFASKMRTKTPQVAVFVTTSGLERTVRLRLSTVESVMLSARADVLDQARETVCPVSLIPQRTFLGRVSAICSGMAQIVASRRCIRDFAIHAVMAVRDHMIPTVSSASHTLPKTPGAPVSAIRSGLGQTVAMPSAIDSSATRNAWAVQDQPQPTVSSAYQMPPVICTGNVFVTRSGVMRTVSCLLGPATRPVMAVRELRRLTVSNALRTLHGTTLGSALVFQTGLVMTARYSLALVILSVIGTTAALDQGQRTASAVPRTRPSM